MFETDVNSMRTLHKSLGLISARKARMVFKNPLSSDRKVGISSLSFLAPHARLVAEECSMAASSPDARDKFFLVNVGEFDPSPASSLSQGMSSLSAASSSLSSATAELSALIPSMDACKAHAESALSKVQNRFNFLTKRQASPALLAVDPESEAAIADAIAEIPEHLGLGEVDRLIAAAKDVLAHARMSLKPGSMLLSKQFC